MSDEKKQQLYHPNELKQHLDTEYHPAKSKFLREHKVQGPCPFGCGKQFAGNDLLIHFRDTAKQSDEHILAIARAGLFAPEFLPLEDRLPATTEHAVVPIEAVLPAGNIDRRGNVTPRSTPTYDSGLPVLRLPTTDPITQTAWWKEHEEGLYGHDADIQQAQRRYMMDVIDNNLRTLTQGQASAANRTRT